MRLQITIFSAIDAEENFGHLRLSPYFFLKAFVYMASWPDSTQASRRVAIDAARAATPGHGSLSPANIFRTGLIRGILERGAFDIVFMCGYDF